MSKTVMLLTLLVCISLVLAGEVETGPPPGQDNPWFHTFPTTPAENGAQMGTATVVNTGETDFCKTSGSPGTGHGEDDAMRVMPFMDWGTDVLVGMPLSLPTFGRLTTDVDEATGDIYVAVLDPNTGVDDTVNVWRSTDGGRNWTEWSLIRGVPGNGNLVDCQVLVGRGPGDTTWVYLFNASDTAGLRVRRMTPDLARFNWVTITPETSIVKVTVDRNTENPQHIFCCWQERDGDIRVMSSSNAGLTWANANYVATGRADPTIAAGGDGYGYIVYRNEVDSTFYRVGRFTNNLVSPAWTFTRIDSASTNRFQRVSIAADRTTPGTSQRAVAFVTYRYTPNNNIGPRYSYTTDGGTSWTASFWPPTNQARATWDFRHPHIRRTYTSGVFRAVVTGMEPTTNFDTLFYAFCRPASPTTWESRATPNDYRATGEFGAGIDYSVDLAGGYVAYRQYGSRNIWIDGWNWTGVAEDVGPVAKASGATVATVFGRETGINLSLPVAANVRATLYDGAGRLAGTVFDGRLDAGRHRLPIQAGRLAEGVYFLNLDLNGKSQTAKLVNVR